MFMNLQMLICLFDLRKIDRLNTISVMLNHLLEGERNYENKGMINFVLTEQSIGQPTQHLNQQ